MGTGRKRMLPFMAVVLLASLLALCGGRTEVKADDPAFVVQPSSAEVDSLSTNTSISIGYEVNFSPKKIEVLSNGVVVSTKTSSLGKKSSVNVSADPKNVPAAIESKVFRMYYDDTNFIDSNEFTVTKLYAFVTQPSDAVVDSMSTNTSANVSYQLNFNPKKIEVFSGDNLIKTYTSNLSYKDYKNIGADPANVSSLIVKKKYRMYYTNELYIDSNEFTVTKTYGFITQPSNAIVDSLSTNTSVNVSYKTNFVPKKIEILSNGNIVRTVTSYLSSNDNYSIGADPANDVSLVEKKKYRMYYTNENYIDSNEFTVTKTYEFITQPSNAIVDPLSTNTSANVSYKTNFVPKKIEILSNGNIVRTVTSYLSSNDYYNIGADPANDVSLVEKKKYRMYYTNENYIDSNEFTVTKSYEFITQPADAVIDLMKTDTSINVGYKLNFTPKKVEILSNDKVVKTATSSLSATDSFGISADPSNVASLIEKKKYRMYYTNEKYIDSDEFTVTKSYEVLVQPDKEYAVDDTSTATTCYVKYKLNYVPYKVEILSNDTVINTYTSNLSYASGYNISADPSNIKDGVENKIIRFYFTGEYFVDSDTFTVKKNYAFIEQPTDQQVDYKSTATTCSEPYKVNFTPIKVEILSDDEVVDTYTTNLSWSDKFTIDADPVIEDKEAPKKKFRVYYIKDKYIDSNEFTVTKDYDFLIDPINTKIEPESEDTAVTVSWQTNFLPKKVEIYSGDEVVDSYTKNKYYSYYYYDDSIHAEDARSIESDRDTEAKDKKVRAYYSETGYVDSEIFTVTKHYHNIVKVDAKAPTCKTKGNLEYYKCSLEGCTYLFKDKDGSERINAIPELDAVATAHVWGDAEFTRAEDYSTVAAKRTCAEDATHVETETAACEKTFRTDDETGKRYEVYTAIFTNAAFGKQVKEVEAKYIIGDVNGDGTVNAKDVTQLRRFLAGGWNVEIDEAACDVNHDGAVNAKDVTQLRRYLAGGWGVKLD